MSSRGTPAPQQVTVAAPASLTGLLGEFRCCFTAPTFAVFCALACGFLAQTGRRTVCGMLVGARLSRVWSHHRAHRFFSHARWSAQQLSAVLARLIVALLVADGQPVTVAIDDTLFHRRGPKVHAASWFHDGSAAGARKVGYGNNWVHRRDRREAAVSGPPARAAGGFRLGAQGNRGLPARAGPPAGRAARRRAARPGASTWSPTRAYAGRALRGLPAAITWTTRLRSNAALYQLAPPRTGRRGRPRLKGERLPALAELAASAAFTATVVHRYGTPQPCKPRCCAACGTACSAPNRCRSCWSATGQPPATASPWSAPT